MPVDLLVAVLILSVLVNLALLVWVSHADHVTLRWPRYLQAAVQALRPKGPSTEIPTVRRRALYVAEHQPRPTIASPVPPAPERESSRPPLAETLPPDLAELLSKRAEVTPHPDGVGFTPSGDGFTGDARLSVGPGSDGGPTILARLPQHHNRAGSAAAGAGLAVDSLTDLEGPTAWSRILEIENARLLRYRRPVTIVMADVEGLRRLAERLGEEPVQRLLPVIADAFVRGARTSDWVARVGEARFGALLPETDEIQAINYVERVRIVCEPWLASAAVPLRLAIGWSSPTASSDLEFAIRRAEERMHADRRMPGRSLQPPRVVPARVVTLPPGEEAGQTAADLDALAGPEVAPAETGRSGGWDGQYGPSDDAFAAQSPESARGRGRRRTDKAVASADDPS